MPYEMPPSHTSGRVESARRSGESTCSPNTSVAEPTATAGSHPSYAGPPAAGNVTTQIASASNASGASQAAGCGTRRPLSTNASRAPIRISPTRAGVAQYAASGPNTAAVTGAATTNTSVTKVSTAVRPRFDAQRPRISA